MRFSDTIDERNLVAVLERATALIGRPRIKARGAILEERFVDRHWGPLTAERNALELTHYRLLSPRGRKMRVNLSNAAERRLIDFLITFDRAYRVCSLHSASAAKALLQKTRACLGIDDGYAPLAYELSTAMHLMRVADVKFHDYEQGAFDFLISRNGTSFEAECKFVTPDKGRVIDRNSITHLGQRVEPRLRSWGATKQGPVHLSVTLYTRLSGNVTLLDEIIDVVKRAWIDQPSPQTKQGIAKAQFLPIAPASSDAIWGAFSRHDEGAIDAIETALGDKHGVRPILIGDGDGYVLMTVEGHQPDKVVEKILRDLKDDARDQFSQKLPAVFFVHMAGLTGQDLVTIKQSQEGNRLAEIAETVFVKRRHMHSIVFTADNERSSLPTAYGLSTRRFGAMVFRSELHPQRDNPDIRVMTDEDLVIA